jgi:beta-phosphoglucomutase-like phosphatase (HAD superfamily)
VLGLPDGVRACLFDLDGVLTQTAEVHAAAWTEMFDGSLRTRALQNGEPFDAFDAVGDYDEYVDGKPRFEGVRWFLGSRGIELPQGDPGDAAGVETICGLGNHKNAGEPVTCPIPLIASGEAPRQPAGRRPARPGA